MTYRFKKITSIGRDIHGFAEQVYRNWPVITFEEVTSSSHEAGFYALILCDCTSNDITVNLPPVSNLQGTIYIIVKTDSSSNTITVDPDGSEQICDDTELVIENQFDAAQILCTGTEWVVI